MAGRSRSDRSLSRVAGLNFHASSRPSARRDAERLRRRGQRRGARGAGAALRPAVASIAWRRGSACSASQAAWRLELRGRSPPTWPRPASSRWSRSASRDRRGFRRRLTAAEGPEATRRDRSRRGRRRAEPLPAGRLDLGEAVAQQLALALDPYPRGRPRRSSGRVGAEHRSPRRESPFVGLAKLKAERLSGMRA